MKLFVRRQTGKQSRNKIRILDEISGSSSTNWEQIPLFCFHHFGWKLQPSPLSRSTHLPLHAAGTGYYPFLVSGLRPCLQFVISPFVILLLHVLKQFTIFEILVVAHLQSGQHAVSYATLPRRVYGSHVFTVHDFAKTRLFCKSHGKDTKTVIVVLCNCGQKLTLKFRTISLLNII